ncbi:MAG: DUF5615 family PIN-like protein [Fimbriimonadaceae bacterium]
MTFLLDNDIPYKIADALAALSKDVRSMRAVYGASAKDTEWIPQAAKDRLVVITADRRLLKNKAEKEALRKHKVTVLFLNPFFSNLKMWDKAVWFIRRWEEMEGFGSAVSYGTMASVSQNGKCTVIPLK